jgi:hypothetical protein
MNEIAGDEKVRETSNDKGEMRGFFASLRMTGFL